MSARFEVGDLVWAKIKGFTPWPAKVVEPTKGVKRPSAKKPMHYVDFFGYKNDTRTWSAWTFEENMYPYEEFKAQYAKKNNTSRFQEAVKEIEEYFNDSPPPPKKIKSTVTNSSKTANDVSSKHKHSHMNHNDLPTMKQKVKKMQKKLDGPQRKIKFVKKSIKHGMYSSQVPAYSNMDSTGSSMGRSLYDQYTPLLATASPYIPSQLMSSSHSPLSHSNSISKTSSLLKRYESVPIAEQHPIDVQKISQILEMKQVTPSDQKFGFLGLGIMGRGIVKNLIHSGHKVTVWNRDPEKCKPFLELGATQCSTPGDVVAGCNITFSCLADPNAAKERVFDNCGVLDQIRPGKGYVEITSIDPETAADISEAIIKRGGRFLEAPVLGSRKPAEDGTLIILAAGDRSLFHDCRTCFEAMGKHAFYLGQVGNGSKMNLILHMMMGTAYVSLAEAMALALRVDISQKDLLDIIKLGPFNCSAFIEKGQAILEGRFPVNMPLQHMQRDLQMALGIGDRHNQPLPTTAAANEVYKRAKGIGYGEHDVSAVYLRGTNF